MAELPGDGGRTLQRAESENPREITLQNEGRRKAEQLMRKKFVLVFLLLLLKTSFLSAQVRQECVARYNGPGNYEDKATAIALDAAGNVYVTGGSWGSGTDFDYATIKYDSNGNQLWVARYNSGNGG